MPGEHGDNGSIPRSGVWAGYYLYSARGARHAQRMKLAFSPAGALSGDGDDDIGFFRVAGQFDPASNVVLWVKTYPGSHDVHYRGFYEKRRIWGTWRIQNTRGGFCIWPEGMQNGETQAEKIADERPAEAAIAANAKMNLSRRFTRKS
ncbi:MAG TPA: hypothetical protein VEK08_24470 [Planctomycetota bacterium]|nr:hypothetical protein [Planctomycetota bacterium]